jgi:TatD DNase family protein
MRSKRSEIIDTHAHLCDPVFDGDRKEVLQRARDAGVAAVVSVGENLLDAERNLRLSEIFPELLPAAGLYPTRLDREEFDAMITFIRREHAKLAAIGEVGLDYWIIKEEGERMIQRERFTGFVDLANELHLPLNVHSRSAGGPALAILLDRGAKRVQLHAFDGKGSTAMPGVEAGYFFSIPPSILRSRQKQKLVKQLPLSSLLIESDSPVLGPSAGERNEPANVPAALRAIAEIKKVSEEHAAEVILENTRRLFGERVGVNR